VRPALCALVGLLCAAQLHAGEFRVVAVSDGDTITVLSADKQQIKIRLAGIDAPESSQAFGNRAKQALAEKVAGKTIEVVTQSKDPYGRTVADLYLEGRWINLELVAEGWAWHYRQYSRDQRLADAEAAARQAGMGLWADKDPIPPWGFRRGERVATVP
jgi:micrococcal nuclease